MIVCASFRVGGAFFPGDADVGRTVDEPTDSGLRSVLCAWRSEAGAQPDAVLGIIIVFPHMVKKSPFSRHVPVAFPQ